MMADIITLYSPGPIPGIPGVSYGPGVYVVDWVARTATPLTVPEPEVDVSDPAVSTDEPQQAS